MKISYKLHTNGRGWWSVRAAKVGIHKIELDSMFDGGSFGDIRVYFLARDWNTDKHGLIYTDPLFLKELKAALLKEGFSKSAVASVEYSEQGMQGDKFVHLQVGKKFLKEFLS
jgi:hypothetical protein